VGIDADLVVRLVVATLIGAVIGLEREVHGSDPGMRTHALVALGAALFTVAGGYGFADARNAVGSDSTRIAAQVAAGIGFIGAGAVLRSGGSVRGLTTAATLWLAAAAGVAAGAGIYVAVAAATLLTLIVLVGLRVAKPWLLGHLGGGHRTIRVEYERGHGTIGPLMRQLDELHCRVAEMRIEDDNESGVDALGIRCVTLVVQTNDGEGLAAAVTSLEARDEILSLSVEPRH
jgi:putative Mg2+ transporter-C (MgtC) family protein